MAKQRTIRKTTPTGAPAFDERLWPIQVALLVLGSFQVGMILANLRFDDHRWYANATLALLAVAAVIGGVMYAISHIDSRVLRRAVMLSLVLSLLSHQVMMLLLLKTKIFSKMFPDTVAALARLKTRYQLGVISNVDDDLFAGSARQLGVDFDWVVTAQQVRSYKPSTNNFERALERIGRPRSEILHCAQSLFHDVGPANGMGLATVWVDRRAGKSGTGATPPSSAKPDLTVPDLATLARLAVG